MTLDSLEETLSPYLLSHSTKPLPKTYKTLVEALSSSSIKFIFRWSRRLVPHLVAEVGSKTYSICWMGRSKVFRVFYPYPNTPDTKAKDLKTEQEVIDYINLDGMT